MPGGSPPTRTLFTVLRRVGLGRLFTLGREWRVPARGDLLRDRGRRAAGHSGTCSPGPTHCTHALVYTRAHPACLCPPGAAAANLLKLFPPSCPGSVLNSVPNACFVGREGPGLVSPPLRFTQLRVRSTTAAGYSPPRRGDRCGRPICQVGLLLPSQAEELRLPGSSRGEAAPTEFQSNQGTSEI